MTPAHVHQALAQVRELRQKILESRRFKGYSGVARAFGGTLALATAAVLASTRYPQTELAHADAWGMLALAAFIINLAALLRWYFSMPAQDREPRLLIPAYNTLPPFIVTSALTIAALLNQDYQYLFPLWMCGYGLVNMSQNYSIVTSIRLVGLFYIICGILLLLVFHTPFTNPWPMGIVFFVGEWWGGLLLHVNNTGNRNILSAFDVTGKGASAYGSEK